MRALQMNLEAPPSWAQLAFFVCTSAAATINTSRKATGGLPDLQTHFAEAPWSETEWAVALLFVELLQAQPGRQANS